MSLPLSLCKPTADAKASGKQAPHSTAAGKMTIAHHSKSLPSTCQTVVAKSSGKEIVVITARCEEDGEFHGIEVGIPLGLDMSNKGNPRSWATLLRTILPASSHAQLEVGPVNVTSKGLIGKPIFFFVTADAQTEKNADGTWAKDPYINLLLASEYNSYKSGKPMGAHATGAQTSTSANNGTNGASTPEVASPFSI